MNGRSLLVLTHNLIDIFKECKRIPEHDIDILKHLIRYGKWGTTILIAKKYGIKLNYKTAGTWTMFIPLEEPDKRIKSTKIVNAYNSIW